MQEVIGSPVPLWEQFAEADDDDDNNNLLDLEVPVVSSELVAKRSCTFLYCNSKTVARISLFVLNSGVFALTSYFIVKEAQGSRNVQILSTCALFNGASISSFFHMIIPANYRKKINTFVSAWTYETVLACSEVYLNVIPQGPYDTPQEQKHLEKLWKLDALPFIWGFGLLEGKDILTLLSMQQADLSLCTVPPNQEDLIRTLGFTTRDYSRAAKLWITGLIITSIGLNVLNFVIFNKYRDDYGQIGLYQDLIALFSGSVLGDVLARLFDDLKEKIETKQLNLLIPQKKAPRSIKVLSTAKSVLRVAKSTFVLFSPIAIGTLLAIPTEPNTLPDYFAKLAVGGVYGSNLLIAKREFENPASHLHSVSRVINETAQAIKTTAEKVKITVKKYFLSVAFFTSLTAYMSWAAATNPIRDAYAVVVLLVTSLLSFTLTDVIAVKHTPSQISNRFLNELSFRFIFGALLLSIFFQYLDTKLNIGDQELDQDSNYLYALSLITWFFWGLNVGNNRAVNIQPRVPSQLPISPPIATQVLSKSLLRTYRINMQINSFPSWFHQTCLSTSIASKLYCKIQEVEGN